MLRLSTSTKIKIARVLRRAVVAVRAAAGQPPTRFVHRRAGLRWNLDLDEGIDLSIFLFGHFEPTTARLIRSLLRPGMIAVDIGANVGAHALPMARAVGPTGRVYAIEPTVWAFDRLTANRALNPSIEQSLILLHALVGTPASVAPSTFYASWALTPNEESHPLHGGSAREIGDARMTTIDDVVDQFGLQRLDLIKLDVDGWECAVLEGSHKTLERFAPPIVLELAPHMLVELGGSLAKLLEILSSHQYELHFEGSRRPLPRSPDQVERLIAHGGSINILAIKDPHRRSSRPGKAR